MTRQDQPLTKEKQVTEKKTTPTAPESATPDEVTLAGFKSVNTLEHMLTPFAPNEIGKLPKPLKKDAEKGNCKECGKYHGLPAVHLDYVGHAAMTKRLLECDMNWTWEPFAIGADGLPLLDRNGGLWIRLTVQSVTRIGYGDSTNQQGTNAIKEAIGDAIRNAAMRFGGALQLWHKGDLFAVEDDEPSGKTFGKGDAEQGGGGTKIAIGKADPSTAYSPVSTSPQQLSSAYNEVLDADSKSALQTLFIKYQLIADIKFKAEDGAPITLREVFTYRASKIEAGN